MTWSLRAKLPFFVAGGGDIECTNTLAFATAIGDVTVPDGDVNTLYFSRATGEVIVTEAIDE